MTAPAARSSATLLQSVGRDPIAVDDRRAGVREPLRLRELLHAHRYPGERTGIPTVGHLRVDLLRARPRAFHVEVDDRVEVVVVRLDALQ